MTRDPLELTVYRLLTCLAATNRIAEVELTLMRAPIPYSPSPLTAALDRLTESVGAVRDALRGDGESDD